MTHASSIRVLSDIDLIARIKRLAHDERHATAALVAALVQMDARRLYLGEGCSSLFVYCTQVLHLSEHAAYNRIEAARVVRRFPLVLERLDTGEITLSSVCLLRPHLTDDNHAELLAAARHATKRAVEQMIARIAPRPDAPVIIRKLPIRKLPEPQTTAEARHVLDAPSGGSANDVTEDAPIASRAAVSVAVQSAGARLEALTAERYKVQFTVRRETHDKLRRAQDLLRHVIPNGDPAEIVDRALTVLLEQLERTKLAVTSSPRRVALRVAAGSRHIAASVRRAVWARDGGRCAFEGAEGRCIETGFLEFHHVVPFARGGTATVENIQLRCRAHNQYEAVEEFGDGALFGRELAPPYDQQVPEPVECGVLNAR